MKMLEAYFHLDCITGFCGRFVRVNSIFPIGINGELVQKLSNVTSLEPVGVTLC